MISSPEDAAKRISDEYKQKKSGAVSLIEALDGEYSRISLDYLSYGLSAQTLGKLFFLSAKRENGSMEQIKEKLCAARALIEDGSLPFDLNEFDEAVANWESTGFDALHHSTAFNESYNPSYRVISNLFVPFLALLAEIDKGLENGSLTIAIDGGSASGKTTLSELLHKIYGCTVFHIDDFFLRPEQRVPERYGQIGGNFDRERFLDEVLIPLDKGETVKYRSFDCSNFKISSPKEITPKKLTVIEGAYSMHPELTKYYDFSVFLDVSKDTQRERILVRSTPELSERFFNEWIPLEDIYFEKTDIKNRCKMLIKIQ